MAAKVITFGIQKGGVGKSTTTSIIAHLLAEEGHKVLVVDMDSQGNATDLLTQIDPEEFEGKTVLEAFHDGNAKPYILKTGNDKIDVLPSDDFLATLARFLYSRQYHGDTKTGALDNLLIPLKGEYDYILIDTPPSLGEQMINSVCASDYVVVLAESSKWAFTAIPRFLALIAHARDNLNKKVRVAGILITETDARTYDSKAFVNLIKKNFSDLTFETIIKRKAKTRRLPIDGFIDNEELSEAIKEYRGFYKEFKKRVGVEDYV